MRKIVIIGATSGIGLRVAEDFARMGWAVGAAGRNTEALKALEEKFPDNVVTERIDVTEPGAVKRFFELIGKNAGMDVMLFCSGVGYENEALDLGREMRTVQVDVVGFTRIVSAAFRYFRDLDRADGTKGGQIAAITSVASTRGIAQMASYSASKRFQRTYLEALEQLSRRQDTGIDFTEIRPGWTRTPLLNPERIYPLTLNPEYVAAMTEAAILKRKRVATIDWRWKAICAVWQLIPRSLWVNAKIEISEPVPPDPLNPASEIVK